MSTASEIPRTLTPGAIAAAWTGDGVIVGFGCPDQADPILAAAKLELTDADLEQIGGAK